MATFYRWILVGHTECQKGEVHHFILHESTDKFASLVKCKANFAEYESGDQCFKGTEYCVRFLCRESVVKDVMTFALNGIASTQSDDPFSSSSEEEEEDAIDGFTRRQKPKEFPDYHVSDDEEDRETDHTKHIGPWEAYRKTKCGIDGHYALHRRHDYVSNNVEDCIYDFSDYFFHI